MIKIVSILMSILTAIMLISTYKGAGLEEMQSRKDLPYVASSTRSSSTSNYSSFGSSGSSSGWSSGK